MELRQLHYVLEIARTLSFSRAAVNLHLAQPSLSQQLAKLEQELGVQLFRRTTNRVELTFAGSLFVERARAIVDSVEQLRQELDDLAQMRRGKLVIGSLPMTGAHILPLVLPRFTEQYPDIEVTLVENTTSALEQLTVAGQTDLSLLSLPVAPELAYEPMLDEQIWLAVPPQHELASRNKAVTLKQLKDEPFIALKQGQGFRQTMIELCESNGFTPRFVFESSNIETVQSLVAAGMGIAFVPDMVTRAKWSELAPKYVQLASPVPTRTLVIAYRSGRYLSHAARAFIETFRETMKEVAR